jgi:hypothetical protein
VVGNWTIGFSDFPQACLVWSGFFVALRELFPSFWSFLTAVLWPKIKEFFFLFLNLNLICVYCGEVCARGRTQSVLGGFFFSGKNLEWLACVCSCSWEGFLYR